MVPEYRISLNFVKILKNKKNIAKISFVLLKGRYALKATCKSYSHVNQIPLSEQFILNAGNTH